MGLIKAAVGAIGGSLADSWLDVIEPDNFTSTTVMTKGVLKSANDKRSSNKKGTQDIISNGSKIHVYPNQMMLLVDSGRIVDYTAEEGVYEVYMSSAPSLFNGELKASIKETFERFKFGGTPSSAQKVYYINLAEIKGIKFGTKNPINYFDNFYNAELFMRCHGNYSVKITDPLKFFAEAVPQGSERVDMEDINEQYLSEFLTALQTSIGQMSVDGQRISHIQSKGTELAKYMENALDADWNERRGMEIQSVGILSISYDDESKQLINMRNQGAMLSDPSVREGYVQGAVARGLEAAGSNTAGASQAFMAMGMGMNGAGNFMGAASASNQAQMQQQQMQQMQQAQANAWKCACGNSNTGKFCSNCGSAMPAPAQGWTCECGSTNTGKFCPMCGKAMPAPATQSWTCSCGAVNTTNFCSTCGSKKA